MNPRTLMRLWAAFEKEGFAPQFQADHRALHTLKIAGETCLWPGAIYRARELGYLRQVEPGLYKPTIKMCREVIRCQEVQRERSEP